MRTLGLLSKICALLAILTVGACSVGPPITESYGSLPEPEDGKGRIYFYRTNVPLLMALEPAIIVNQKLVGHARHATVFFQDTLPGRYEVFLESDRGNVLSFTIGAGQLRFVRTYVDFTITGTELTLELVEEDKGRLDAESLTMQEPAPTDLSNGLPADSG
ncbi:MAG: DUF2846 domain-containing protein [Pseudomonadota bacterium]